MRRQKDFPKFFDIGDDRWQVRFCRSIPDHKPEVVGLCDPGSYTIWIKQGQSPGERFKTAVHEALHAAETSCGFEIPHRVVYALEKACLELWESNFGKLK